MEKSDRSEIAHKIRLYSPSALPELSPRSVALKEYLMTFFSKRIETDRIKAVGDIYQALDRIMDEKSAHTVCRKGCAYCCKMKVDVSLIEAEYIAHKTGLKIAKTNKTDNSYCPFLDQSTAMCTIYPYRPFACRAFATFDSPDYCANGEKHFITGGPLEKWGDSAVYALFMRLVDAELGEKLRLKQKKQIKKIIRDIRQWFG